MNTTMEIGKAGRFVLPKKVRDEMQVREGDRFTVEQRNDEIVLRPERGRRLVRSRGMWVMAGGPKQTSDTSRQQIDEGYLERERRIMNAADGD